jgi:hypothetical protein
MRNKSFQISSKYDVSTRQDPTFARAVDSIRSVLGIRQPVMVTVRSGRRHPTRLHARLSEIKSR